MTVASLTHPTATNRSAQQTRTRALVVPREHGAWGLLLVPLCTGGIVGLAATRHPWPLILLTVTTLSLFWLRTPVESLLGTTALSAETPEERRLSLLVVVGLAAVSCTCLTTLLWNGRNRGLLLLGGMAALAFVGQTILIKFGRKLRMAAQSIGVIGLTCTAPAAYYVVTGRLDAHAWLLWAANCIFAGNQIHFVQLRIHAARAASFGEKFARGRGFFLAQAALLPGLAIASGWKIIPALVIVAFIPALFRGFHWFFGGYQPLRVKSLGWSEMRQGILFGILLAAAIVVS